MNSIRLKSKAEIKAIYHSGLIAGKLMLKLKELIKPGITTLELDEFAYSFIKESGGEPAFKGYQGFPATLCTSINHEVVHGIPSRNVRLKEGDLLKIDTGVILNGLYSDTAYTFWVGDADVPSRVVQLMRATEEALYLGISKATAGKRLNEISTAIYTRITRDGLKIIRELTGHGIGLELHEPPVLHNFPTQGGRSIIIREGLVLAVEPMASISSEQVILSKDHWTYITADGSLSAHYEHTIAIVEGEAIILTKYDDEKAKDILG